MIFAASVVLDVLRLLVALPLLAASTPPPDPVRPDPVLTPGAVLSANPDRFCYPGYSNTVRHTTDGMKRRVFAAYGIPQDSARYEIDHLIPLSLGGADVPANLWPQSYETFPYNAHVKDRLEMKLLGLVCGGKLSARQAQADIARDWVAAYRLYCAAGCIGAGAMRPEQ